MCEVRVNDVNYTGAGNSTNKKDAEKNAARDFVNFLVRTGQLNAGDIPAEAIEQGGALPARMTAPSESVPVFQVSFGQLSSPTGGVNKMTIATGYREAKARKILDKHIDR